MQALLSTLSSVGFDWHIALANFVNFLIVFVILYKLVFTKLSTTLTHRAKKIEQGLDDAAKGHLLLADAEKDKARLIKEAEDAHVKIVEEAEIKADKVASEIVAEAKEKAESMKHALEEEKQQLQASVEKEFNEKAPKLVASLFEKTLASSMTKETNDAFIASLSK